MHLTLTININIIINNIIIIITTTTTTTATTTHFLVFFFLHYSIHGGGNFGLPLRFFGGFGGGALRCRLLGALRGGHDSRFALARLLRLERDAAAALSVGALLALRGEARALSLGLTTRRLLGLGCGRRFLGSHFFFFVLFLCHRFLAVRGALRRSLASLLR